MGGIASSPHHRIAGAPGLDSETGDRVGSYRWGAPSLKLAPQTRCHPERTGPQTSFSLGVVSRRICWFEQLIYDMSRVPHPSSFSNDGWDSSDLNLKQSQKHLPPTIDARRQPLLPPILQSTGWERGLVRRRQGRRELCIESAGRAERRVKQPRRETPAAGPAQAIPPPTDSDCGPAYTPRESHLPTPAMGNRCEIARDGL